MRKLLVIGAFGVVTVLGRKILGLLRRSPDFTDVDARHPQRTVEAMEHATEVPGGVRP